MTSIHDFALLAPVPLEHLQSGLAVAEATGFVAFGTRKWDLLRDLRAKLGYSDGRVAVLIYPSRNEDAPVRNDFVVSWFGWYAGSEETNNGAHPGKMKHRPPSTANSPTDNLNHWAAFWHVSGLRELPRAKHIPIGKIGRVPGGLRKDAAPRGPELVALPEALSYET